MQYQPAFAVCGAAGSGETSVIVNSMANANNTLKQYTQPQYGPPQIRATAKAIAPTSGATLSAFDGSRFTAIVLLLATIASGMMLVYSRHQARTLFQQLEALSSQHDEQQIEWGRLQLEQATWSENSRIEQIARDRLGLDFPEQTKVVVIKQ